MTAKHIWIIGASSGIGRALAVELSRRGHSLVLSARRAEKLAALNAELGDRHVVAPLDATDSAAVSKIHDGIKKLDGVVYMSGAYDPKPVHDIDLETARTIVDVNLMGVLYLVDCVLPRFLDVGKGQIALCGSIAGYSGLPMAQPYGATKAALINYAETLRLETADKGVDVKLINPGFVETPMTDKNDFHMPMKISPQAAARAIADGLEKKAFEIHMPKKFTRLLKLLRILPYGLYFPIVRRLVK